MLRFPLIHLVDEGECARYLERVLHPDGLEVHDNRREGFWAEMRTLLRGFQRGHKRYLDNTWPWRSGHATRKG